MHLNPHPPAHDNLVFHNVAELVPAPGGGLHLARFPVSVWPHAEAPAGCDTIRSSNACEIQFATHVRRIRLYLRSLVGDANIVHLIGNHVHSYERLEAGKIHCLEIAPPALEPNRNPAVRKLGGYNPEVYRIVSIGSTLAYHGVEVLQGNLQAPAHDACPALRWLAYGSSITQSGASYHGYVNGAAQLLEVAPINLGMGGSCWIEPAIADFIASRQDWDFASFELGINMVDPADNNTGFTKKVDYLLDTVTAAHPAKKIFLLTILDHGVYHEIESSPFHRDILAKNDILRHAAARHPQQVVLLEGTKIVPDLRGFQVDLLHPEPFAATRMAIQLANAIASVIDREECIQHSRRCRANTNHAKWTDVPRNPSIHPTNP